MTVTAHEIREALDPPAVRGLQIMQLAHMVGITAFAAYVIGRVLLDPEGPGIGEPRSTDYFRVATIVNFVVWTASYLIGNLLFRRGLAPTAPDTAVSRVSSLRTGFLRRLGFMEGSGLLGLAICFIASDSGAPVPPFVWLNLLSPGFFLLFAVSTFPTQERLTALLTERVG
jgi:hypothetical protein